MLLQFTVENFLCFAEEAVFSMIATSDDSHMDHLIEKRDGKHLRVLRSAAIYGANG